MEQTQKTNTARWAKKLTEGQLDYVLSVLSQEKRERKTVNKQVEVVELLPIIGFDNFPTHYILMNKETLQQVYEKPDYIKQKILRFSDGFNDYHRYRDGNSTDKIYSINLQYWYSEKELLERKCKILQINNYE